MKEKMLELEHHIRNIGIVPVIKINDEKNAVPLAKALIEGGLPVAEVTFRTDAAEASIKEMSAKYPDLLVGAGTVLNIEQAEKAIRAGAKFIVSPGFNRETVQFCLDKGIPVIPGCSTASDLEQAISMGLDTVKFFPSEAVGGLAVLKALSGPYPQLNFMPTGGININNMTEYLKFEKVLACGGTWMVKDSYIENEEFETIKRLTQDTVAKMLDFKVESLPEDDILSQTQLASIFNEDIDKVIIKTRDLSRAVYHLEMTGLELEVHSDHLNSYYAITKEKYNGRKIKIIEKGEK